MQPKPEKQKSETQIEANEQTPPAPDSTQIDKNQSQGLGQSGQFGQSHGLSRPGQFSSPFSFMRRFSEEMDRLFDDFGFGTGLFRPTFGRSFEKSMWSPQTEFFERGNELVIRADLPGMTKDDINVDIEDDQIIIRGERRDERESNEQGFYHSERSYGSFYRTIPLPKGIDGDQANASFQNGVLEITLPKPEPKPRGRKIEIGEASSTNQPSHPTDKTKNQ